MLLRFTSSSAGLEEFCEGLVFIAFAASIAERASSREWEAKSIALTLRLAVAKVPPQPH